MKKKNKERILVTGCAGFIGMHLSKSLLEQNYNVIGVDNLNDYYSFKLKEDRLNVLKNYNSFKFKKIDISKKNDLEKVFKNNLIDKVVNLAAQAGVMYSLKNPNSYVESNILGFMNILECCRHYNIKGLIYASSSSVYGGNKELPFSVDHNVDNPLSIYAATKISNELMAKVYSNLFDLHTTGLRFFTVYGPWGRPDMSYFSFTRKMLDNNTIEVYDNGKVERDFTYIDDIVSGIRSAISNNFKNEIFNLGNNKTEKVLTLITIIEKELNKKVKIQLKPLKPGDVQKTNANISKSKKMLGYSPKTNIQEGLSNFINWYFDYYNV